MAFLLTRSNPHAPLRSNGLRGWYHPTRNGGLGAIRAIALHTAETPPSPASAENVARWQRDSATVASSYHVLVDSDTTLRTLPDEATAFHVAASNTWLLGLSWATYAAWWGRYPAWDEPALRRGAAQVADWCRTYGIPVRQITGPQARAGARGIVTHAALDPARRSDPGARFPMDRFLSYVESAAPGASSTPASLLEEIAAMDPKDRQKLIGEIADAVHQRTVTTHYPDGAEQLRADTLWARAAIASAAARDAAQAAAAGVPVDVIESMRRTQEALAVEVVASIRRDAGRPADPASDRVWVDRLAAGTHTIADARRALTA